MSYRMTQSLLHSWILSQTADDLYADQMLESFLSMLRREQRQPTQAMQDGIRFEEAVNAVVAGKTVESVNEKWDRAVLEVAKECFGGQPQVPVFGSIRVCGMDFSLYGICDYIHAGRIIDIKKPSRYEYGKYFDSPQHPMYLHLVPEASQFDYLIFDGSHVYRESYRRGDFQPIEQTISAFVSYLYDTGHMGTYRSYWSLDAIAQSRRAGASNDHHRESPLH